MSNRELTLIHDSLLRRMQTMHSMFYEAVDTMDVEQVNHVDQHWGTPDLERTMAVENQYGDSRAWQR